MSTTSVVNVHRGGPLVALAGNPNCGKTALFNRQTGNRQKVANYAGVSVERKEGQLDRIVLHRIWGPLLLMVVLFLVIQSVFAWAEGPMDLIKALAYLSAFITYRVALAMGWG